MLWGEDSTAKKSTSKTDLRQGALQIVKSAKELDVFEREKPNWRKQKHGSNLNESRSC